MNGKSNKCELLALIMNRLVQFYSVLSSLQISTNQKIEILAKAQNFDLTQTPLLIVEAQRPEQHEKFLQAANAIVPRILMNLQSQLLCQTSKQQQHYFEEFGAIILKSYLQLRPQLFPGFVYNLMGLASEATLLGALEMRIAPGNVDCEANCNVIFARNVQVCYKNELWALYAKLLGQLLQFVYNYTKSPSSYS